MSTLISSNVAIKPARGFPERESFVNRETTKALQQIGLSAESISRLVNNIWSHKEAKISYQAGQPMGFVIFDRFFYSSPELGLPVFYMDAISVDFGNFDLSKIHLKNLIDAVSEFASNLLRTAKLPAVQLTLSSKEFDNSLIQLLKEVGFQFSFFGNLQRLVLNPITDRGLLMDSFLISPEISIKLLTSINKIRFIARGRKTMQIIAADRSTFLEKKSYLLFYSKSFSFAFCQVTSVKNYRNITDLFKNENLLASEVNCPTQKMAESELLSHRQIQHIISRRSRSLAIHFVCLYEKS